IVTGACRGNIIRRRVYTLTGRAKDLPLCRGHQVEISSMKIALPVTLPGARRGRRGTDAPSTSTT
ncbi:MAG TPA: hypothetical protein VEH10_00380, partial [Thermoplasmata archaeon]|nr:hypothetical protein [Thermoplasmata archaeon]